MTINAKQDELIGEFELFGGWMDKYEYIIELGKELPLIAEEYRKDENLIRGCQAKVWLHAELVDGSVRFTADSDAIITRGLVSMVVKILSGHTPREIQQAELYFIDRVGLKDHLSPTRANGLLSMVRQMKLFALAFQTFQTP
ncbi:MAG TPA: SufE family protein [Chitinophagaceae bacterium]|nr:SufE family protein [Chitinophagaceae bacterium]